jgi:AbrB family looped-hinge helix DNA binding protein
MQPHVTSASRQAKGEVVKGLSTKSAKIIALYREGYSRSEIANYLEIRYQHARNVLVQAGYPSPQLDLAIDQDVSSGGRVSEEPPEQMRVTVGPGGRIVIPAVYRQALGIEEGDSLILRYEGDSVRVVSHSAEVKRVRDLISRHVPEGVSLVDELIAERRREAEREERGE